jgi:hypothetical protein
LSLVNPGLFFVHAFSLFLTQFTLEDDKSCGPRIAYFVVRMK